MAVFSSCIEVHPDPDHALSDGAQTLDFPAFEKLLGQVRTLGEHLGRTM
jgi:3-deoxy-7-phosphoheptulonate synthase